MYNSIHAYGTEVNEMDEKDKRIKELEQQVAELNERIAFLTSKLFGKKTEKTRRLQEDDRQLDLFDLEEEQSEKTEDSKEASVKSYTKKIRKKNRKIDTSKISVEIVNHVMPDEKCSCPKCCARLVQVANPKIREEVKFIPAKLRLLEHHQAVYKCPECSSDDHSKISKAPMPRSLISHSKTGSPSIIAHIAAMKYVYKVPCYRQEAMWKLRGLPLTRQQMSKWMIDVFNNQLSPLYDLLLKELKRQRFLHVDETPYNTLASEKANTYYWVVTSGKFEEKNIAAFTHSDGRSSDTAKKLLSDFNGYVQTDGYAGYNFLDRTRHLGCLAHVRRYFVDSLKNSSYKASKSFSGEIVKDIDEVFELERKLSAKFNDNERLNYRRRKLLPVVKRVFSKIASVTASAKSALGRAKNYALGQEKNILNIFEKGYFELSNNSAERAVKESVMGRKNWLFSSTFEGARANAVALSLIYTAKLNQLDPEKYLRKVLTEITNIEVFDPERFRQLLPWNIDLTS